MDRPAFVSSCALVCVALFLPAAAPAAPPPATSATPATFAAKTAGLERRAGLLTTWLDRRGGRLLLELPAPSGARGTCGSFLYLEGIRSGLGSNPVGLDRGQEGDAVVVTFRRVGARVLLEQPNLRYRAQTADSNEVRAVRESFASSVLWAAPIEAKGPGGRLLVDFTSFLVRDAHGAVAALKTAKQGTFTLDEKRSTLDPEGCKAFPENLEFEAVLTFGGDEPGSEVRATAPFPRAITIEQHQSLVKLPDDGYTPRAWDPRSGSFGVLFADYASPIAADLDVRRMVRFRLEKADPSAARSHAKKPIVFYVDNAAPEPIRAALVEGASWWTKAFEAAGFTDAFQVKVLPPGVDPLDVRYNVIEWVHRATRGWSYGGGITDPRTGEMIKGHVTLGSLRIRQDRMIFEGLVGAAKTHTGAADDPEQLALARIRQLAAHEVGHTLGFAHNFAASSYAGRASVMDYPAPLVRVGTGGELDFSQAYGTGVGVWDVQQVRYAYSQWPTADEEKEGLAAILRENREKHYLYVSDPDTRPAGAAHPLGAMWDNGGDPVGELEHELDVRRIALARFGAGNLAAGLPQGRLAAVLVPLYFHHRYALEAAAKSIGGLDYSYAVSGDPDPPAKPLPATRQREALNAVVATLDPALLDLPEPLLALLPPAPSDDPPHHEYFGASTAPAFDALGAAATAADLTLSVLLPPERLARLVDFHRRDPASPGLDDLLDAIVGQVFRDRVAAASPQFRGVRKIPAAPAAPTTSPRLAAIARTLEAVTVRRLLAAAANPSQTTAVRAAIEGSLQRLSSALEERPGADRADGDQRALLVRDIQRYFSAPAAAGTTPVLAAAPDLPPGPPIGAWDDDECGWEWSRP